MISTAGMSMKDAGLVPPMMAPMRMPPKAMPMERPVESFIGSSSANSPDSFNRAGRCPGGAGSHPLGCVGPVKLPAKAGGCSVVLFGSVRVGLGGIAPVDREQHALGGAASVDAMRLGRGLLASAVQCSGEDI